MLALLGVHAHRAKSFKLSTDPLFFDKAPLSPTQMYEGLWILPPLATSSRARFCLI